MRKLKPLGSPTRCSGYTYGHQCDATPTNQLFIYVERERCEIEIWVCEEHFRKLDNPPGTFSAMPRERK